MKATGIVRRVDELGRIVVPKEMRDSMRIRNGDEVEIFVEDDDKIVMKKYLPLGKLAETTLQYIEAINTVSKIAVAAVECDTIVACAGFPEKEITDNKITSELMEIINKKQLYLCNKHDQPIQFCICSSKYYVKAMMPIMNQNGLLGAIIITYTESEKKAIPTDSEIQQIQTAALFLSKQF